MTEKHYERIGAVLAAGEAVRLPNKVLLPIAGGLICIESAIQFCFENRCTSIIVVHGPEDISLVQPVLRARGWDRLKFVEQPMGCTHGIIDAIRIAEEWCDTKGSELLITFADNVYPDSDLVIMPAQEFGVRCAASVREVNNLHRASQLDKYNPINDMWLPRHPGDAVFNATCFAGWVLTRLPTHVYGNTSIVGWLNRVRAVHVPQAEEGWWDIGTSYSYIKYCESLWQPAS